jgi:uncharacterized membrane protein
MKPGLLQSEGLVALTLRLGAHTSFALLLIAVALALAGLRDIAMALASAGVLVLLATPLLRIVAAMVMFLKAQDMKMTLVSVVLLVVVITASILGVKLH